MEKTVSEQLSIPACEITPSSRLLLHKHDTWIATRFGLYRNKRMERNELDVGRVRMWTHLYEIKTLNAEWIKTLMDMLEELNIRHEWL